MLFFNNGVVYLGKEIKKIDFSDLLSKDERINNRAIFLILSIICIKPLDTSGLQCKSNALDLNKLAFGGIRSPCVMLHKLVLHNQICILNCVQWVPRN